MLYKDELHYTRFADFIIVAKIEDNKIHFQLNSILGPLNKDQGVSPEIFLDEVNLYRLVFSEHSKDRFEFQDHLIDVILPSLREKL